MFALQFRPVKNLVALAPVHHQVSPVREQAAAAIRQQIINGNFQAGERLIERELCEQLQVSRSTLREAYRQLEAEGFVVTQPHRGPVVATISPGEAAALYEVREAFEGLAIRLFTLRASDAERQLLREKFEVLRVAHEQGEVGAMLQAKEDFYAVLYEGARNDILRGNATLLRSRLAQLRARSLSHGDRPVASIAEITTVMELIAQGRADAAADAWCRHIRRAAATVSEALEATGQ